MKLYIFETCPFCVRVRIMAGLKGLTPDLIYVSPGQIPPELEGRIDRLAVPILADGETLIQDSTEIIRHLDAHGTPLLQSYGTSQALEEWRTSISAPLSALCYPRMPQLNVPELASPDALAFFEGSMPKRIGMPFADLPRFAMSQIFLRRRLPVVGPWWRMLHSVRTGTRPN